MKNYLLNWLSFGLAFLFCSTLSSQITFQKTFGGSTDDVANWVANTATGYIVAGYTTTSTGGRDGYLLNLDFSGNTIWQKRIGGNAADQFNVVYESTGGFMVLGETMSYGAGGGDAWILKISAVGTILWSKTIGDASTTDSGTSMIAVPGNRILVSGHQAPTGTTGNNSCFYLLDNNGQVIWSRTYESGGTGNLMRASYVENGVIYASGGAEAEGALLRIDLETGAVLSAMMYPGNSTEALYYQQPAPDGNIMLCDHTWSATNGAEIKQWVNKITPQGQTIWSKVYSRPNGNLRGRIELTGDGNFLLTPYDGLFTANGDPILVKIDAGGNIMWSRNYGRPGLDMFWKAQLAPDGGFVAVGSTAGANGDRDVLIVKTDYEGLVAGCCIPKAGVVAQNYTHPDVDFSFAPSEWASSAATNNQTVNANLQAQTYCGNPLVEVLNNIGLCADEVFTLNGIDYYAPDEIDVTLPGLFGCDTIVHYELLLLPQVTRTETIAFCPGTTVDLGGQSYSAPDTVVLHFSAPSGCDTLVTYYLVYDTSPGSCLGCKGTYLKIVGDQGQNVRGHGIYDAGDGNFYVTGTKQDSALLLKMTPSGSIIWSRTFDIVPAAVDNIAEIIVDSDGMIAGCGQSGDVQPVEAGFAFRYNPGNNTMLWTQIFTSGSAFVMGIMEKSPGGNYILNSNPHQPANNAQLTEVSRATGAFVPGLLSKTLDLGGGDNFNSTMIFNGKLYGVGRFTAGNQFTDMRHTISRLDVTSGQVDYMNIGHLFAGPPARLYGMDFVIKNNGIKSVGFGDETGENLDNSKIFFYNNSLDAVGGPTFRIDLLATTSEAVDEIVQVPDGYVLLCHSLFNAPADIFLVKINDLGNIVWSKKIDYNNDQLLPVSIVQSQILAKDGFLYCIATTTSNTGEQRMMILKIAQNGEMDGDCDYISDTPVTADLVPMTSGQGVTPIETPITETLTSLSVSVTNSTPASEFLCRELVDELVSISLCPGETVTLGGQVYSESDTVVIILTNSIGCDSTITYVLTLRPPPAEVFNDIGLCANEAFTFEGVDYYAPGEVIDTLTSVSGCDSLIHYGLILLPPPAEVFNDIGLCENEAFTFGGVDYYAPGEVIDTLTSVSGCDSLVHYGLILLPPPAEVFNDIGLCPNEAFTFEGVDYYAPGEVVDTLSSVFGCDSIVHYGLILFPQPTQAITISFCPGTGVLIGGQTYSQSGTVIDTIPGLTGCDTIVTYTLVKLEYPTRSQTIEFCPGETILIGGQPYTQPGIVVDTIPATAGCDTIATYTLVSLTPAPSVVSIQCPTNVSLIAEPGTAPLVINYNLPTATSDCPCPGVALTLTAGLPSGGAFPNGISQVCYTAKDSCGHSASCCFNVTVREVQPCDVKVNGCMRYELLSITADVDHNLTYRIRVINNCPNKLIYTAIQLPDGEVAMEPDHLSVFTSEGGRDYDVRNPNFSPFYSIRFKSTTDSISGGQSDIFKYTLPAQLAPAYMDITSRLAPQIFIEAHLNTFYCPIGITAPKNRNDVTDAEREDGELLLFPNPTDGTLWVDLATWSAVSQEWRIFNSQGQQLLKGNTATDEALLRIELPQGVPNGLFFFEIIDIDGAKKTARFVLQR